MKELNITKDELAKLFQNNIIIDTDKGWFYRNKEIEIIAVHDKETKYIQNLTNSKNYKIKFKS